MKLSDLRLRFGIKRELKQEQPPTQDDTLEWVGFDEAAGPDRTVFMSRTRGTAMLKKGTWKIEIDDVPLATTSDVVNLKFDCYPRPFVRLYLEPDEKRFTILFEKAHDIDIEVEWEVIALDPRMG